MVHYWHLPLLLGVDLAEPVSLYATIGPSGAADQHDAILFPRAGLGMEARTSDSFAFHPEATCLIVEGDSPFCLLGLGLTFGKLR